MTGVMIWYARVLRFVALNVLLLTRALSSWELLGGCERLKGPEKVVVERGKR